MPVDSQGPLFPVGVNSQKKFPTNLAVIASVATILVLALIWPSLTKVLLSTEYLPHRFCYLAKPDLIWTHVIADVITGISYTVISFTLAWLIYKGRRDIPFQWMFIAFGLFIVACGGTHFMEAVTTWIPVYVLSGALKVFTAMISGVTAVVLPFTVPRILNLVREAKASGANKEKFVALLETAPDAMIVVNESGEIVLVNAQTEKVFGYRRNELLGQKAEILVPERFRSGYQGNRSNLFTSAEVSAKGTNKEQMGLRKDGEEFPAEISLSPLRTEEGTLISSMIRDLTERKRAEEDLRQAQRVESLGRLSGGIAHDFNNVLSIILGHCELLGDRIPMSDPARDGIEQINSAAQHAADLTRQLLAFGRQQVMQAKVVRLNHILVEMKSMLQRLIGEDIEISIHQGQSLWHVKADPTQMTQIIMNLALNARDAMPEGGKLTIETENVILDSDAVRLHHDVPPGEYVLLAITDTGIGMDDKTRSRVFDPFFTTKEMGKGTGLGLATVHGVVKQSGGFIWVYSEPDQGTTFKIYLPRTIAPASAEIPKLSFRETPAGSETILVLEDNEQVREVAVAFLTSFGYRVLQAEEPEQALEIAKTYQGHIHLLVTDVVLPRMNGRIVGEKLVAMRPSIKVLYVSGYTSNVIVRKGILDDGVAFLQKPYTREGLASKVREMLDTPQDGKD